MEGNVTENKKNKDPETYINSMDMEFILIPAGEFQMGSPSEEKNWYKNEHPVHNVIIETPFYLGKFSITQSQWLELMGTNPSRFAGDDRPVDRVSWNDAQEFINRLNAKEDSNKYRLPSEAEWEYACRAGTTTRYSFGNSESKLDEYAWYRENSEHGSHPVGKKNPNPWGLYDMHGNLWEWVQDIYHESYDGAPEDGSAWENNTNYSKIMQVLCGGSWQTSAVGCRSASRTYYPPVARRNSSRIGFRILKEL
ncbi:MAG: formylglycine-generating enzyme family protein [Methanohalobium sp.]|uniref:formylglycine-generating enzyme family protein n=1 Tax=Methanohalobium sp. TaxID=2837493 RepID=UPI00397A7944